jgi:predicted CoA-binding protein
MAIMDDKIDAFLSGSSFAVVGASTNRQKYGNKVLRCYLQHGLTAIPINPRADSIEGVAAVANLHSLPAPVHGVSVITPPKISEQVVEEAAEVGINHIWFQPGAESAEAIRKAEAAGMNVIADGSCLLVVLGYKDEI